MWLKQLWLLDRKMRANSSEAFRGSRVHTVQEVSALASETHGIAPAVHTWLQAADTQSSTPVLIGPLGTVLTTLVSVSLWIDNKQKRLVTYWLHCLKGEQAFNKIFEGCCRISMLGWAIIERWSYLSFFLSVNGKTQ